MERDMDLIRKILISIVNGNDFKAIAIEYIKEAINIL